MTTSCTGNCNQGRDCSCQEARPNDCDTCANKPYRNGAGGPCKTCVENSNWHNDRELRHAASEVQIGGSHYKAMPIQPFDYITKNGIGFAEGSVIKYVSRWRAKNGIEDLRKARHFLDLLIEHEERAAP